MLRHSLILFAVTAVALAAVARQALEEKPEEYKNCDGCWISKINQFVPTNQSVPSTEECMEYRCTPTEVLLISCGAVAVTPPCYKQTDMARAYPGCCPIIVCPEFEEEEEVTPRYDNDNNADDISIN